MTETFDCFTDSDNTQKQTNLGFNQNQFRHKSSWNSDVKSVFPNIKQMENTLNKLI